MHRSRYRENNEAVGNLSISRPRSLAPSKNSRMTFHDRSTLTRRSRLRSLLRSRFFSGYNRDARADGVDLWKKQVAASEIADYENRAFAKGPHRARQYTWKTAGSSVSSPEVILAKLRNLVPCHVEIPFRKISNIVLGWCWWEGSISPRKLFVFHVWHALFLF